MSKAEKDYQRYPFARNERSVKQARYNPMARPEPQGVKHERSSSLNNDSNTGANYDDSFNVSNRISGQSDPTPAFLTVASPFSNAPSIPESVYLPHTQSISKLLTPANDNINDNSADNVKVKVEAEEEEEEELDLEITGIEVVQHQLQQGEDSLLDYSQRESFLDPGQSGQSKCISSCYTLDIASWASNLFSLNTFITRGKWCCY